MAEGVRVWHIALFGGLQVRLGDRETKPLTGKEGTLLATLALAPSHSRTRLELAAQLWPEEDDNTGRHNLRQTLNQLRRRLKDELGSDALLDGNRDTIALAPGEGVTTDVGEFEKALRAAKRAATDAERDPFLARAVALYRGDLLPGFYSDDVHLERNRLRSEYLNAGRQWAEILANRGEGEQALGLARCLVTFDALEEDSQELLVRLLLTQGRYQEAQRCYGEWVQLSQAHFGSGPSFVLPELPVPAGRVVSLFPARASERVPSLTPLTPSVVPPPPPDVPISTPTRSQESSRLRAVRRRWWMVAVPVVTVMVALLWFVRQRPTPLPLITLDNARATVQELQQLATAPVWEIPIAQTARRSRHADLTLAIVEKAQANLIGPDESVWTKHLEAIDKTEDMDNAFDWFLQHDPEKALQLSGGLRDYRWRQEKVGQAKGRDWIDRALQRAPKSHSLAKARALYGYAFLAVYLPKDGGMTERRCQEALQICEDNGDTKGVRRSRRLLGLTYARYKQYPQALKLYKQVLEECQSAQDSEGQANTLLCMAHCHGFSVKSPHRPFDDQADCARQALQLFHQCQSGYGIGRATDTLARLTKNMEGFPASSQLPACYEALLKEYRLKAQRPELHATGDQRKAYQDMLHIAARLNDKPAVAEALKWFLWSDKRCSTEFASGALHKLDEQEKGTLLDAQERQWLQQFRRSSTPQSITVFEEGRRATLSRIADRILKETR